MSVRYEGPGICEEDRRRMVEAHGGRAGVASEPGHGVTFRFALSLEDVDVGVMEW